MTEQSRSPESLELEIRELRARLDAANVERERLLADARLSRLFVEAADEGLWAINAEARTVHANLKMAEMLGTTLADLLGASMYEFTDERGAAQARSNVERRRRGISEVHEFVFVRRDAKRFLARVRAAPIFSDDGRYQGAVALVADITDDRRAADELRKQKDDFRLIFDSTRAMIWFKDAENRILRANRLAAQNSGLSIAEIEGRSSYDLFPAQAAAYHKDDLEVIRSNRPKLGIVESIVNAGGETRWIQTDKIPCRDERGEPIGVVVFATDITDARRAEQALAESERRYRNLVELAHDLIWSVDAEGRWTFLSRNATNRIYGCEPEAMLGRKFTDFESPERQLLDLATFGRVLSGETVLEYETEHRRPDGRSRYLSFNAVVLRDANGSVIGATGTAHDVTDRKRAESERAAINARFVQTQKLESLGVLAGGIAHDFNNLLVGILGNAGLALTELPPQSPLRELVEGIRDSGLRAAELARQMLAYSGRGRFVVEPFDISHLVDEMLNLLSAVISKKAVLKVELDSNLPGVVGDATQMRQVIMNLITNASDSLGDREGTIYVTSGVFQADAAYLSRAYLAEELMPGEYVFVEVRDEGDGMDPETQARMFEPFFTTKFTGRGLGLAAVLGIVRGHHGTIRVDSAPGRGTTIRVAFPASRDARVVAKEQTPVAPTVRSPRTLGTVLIVDDEPGVRKVAKKVLENAGLKVLIAADGREALEIFRARRAEIAATIVDLTMPHLSGEETVRELRAIDPTARIVLTSGYTEQDAVDRFAGAQLSGFLRKPFTPEELLSIVRDAIEG